MSGLYQQVTDMPDLAAPHDLPFIDPCCDYITPWGKLFDMGIVSSPDPDCQRCNHAASYHGNSSSNTSCGKYDQDAQGCDCNELRVLMEWDSIVLGGRGWKL